MCFQSRLDLFCHMSHGHHTTYSICFHHMSHSSNTANNQKFLQRTLGSIHIDQLNIPPPKKHFVPCILDASWLYQHCFEKHYWMLQFWNGSQYMSVFSRIKINTFFLAHLWNIQPLGMMQKNIKYEATTRTTCTIQYWWSKLGIHVRKHVRLLPTLSHRRCGPFLVSPSLCSIHCIQPSLDDLQISRRQRLWAERSGEELWTPDMHPQSVHLASLFPSWWQEYGKLRCSISCFTPCPHWPRTTMSCSLSRKHALPLLPLNTNRTTAKQYEAWNEANRTV